MQMSHRQPLLRFAFAAFLAICVLSNAPPAHAAEKSNPAADFLTSERCLSCHGSLKAENGKDASIGVEWGASIMANSARDPYWQGSVRREVLDHPEAGAAIQTECATCHMPLQYLQDHAQGHPTVVFKRLPLSTQNADDAASADGVTCTVCHQIQPTGLGTPATDNGNFAVAPPGTHPRPIFGPFAPEPATVTQVHVLTTGYAPVQSATIREASLCGSCHTLYTTAYGPGGKPIGKLPEQMTYLEWLHSDYKDKQTCQQCHMRPVEGKTIIASVLSGSREGVRHHTFVGANVFMLAMLSAHPSGLAVTAQPAALAAAIADTTAFMQSQSAHVTVSTAQLSASQLSFAVKVENLTGHKLPTAFPSRRAWLHVTVTAAGGRTVFESGKLNPDGSIAGNANDADPTRYSPHYTEITKPGEVEIFEPILGDSQGRVTTGVLTATQYLKDNRILPAGFDKKTAPPDIAVHGKAAGDPDFTAGSSTTHYAVSTAGATGPFHISAELVYQPIGYRWAHNLASYKAKEPQQFVRYYEQAAAHSAIVLAHATSAAK
jgi:hypothetical protein